MFNIHLKIALRNIFKHKIYSFINITGLAIGILAAIVIGVYIFTEISYDKFNEKSDRIYRVATYLEFGGNGMNLASNSFVVAPVLKNEFPEVENAARLRRFFYTNTPVKYNEVQFIERNVFYADPSIFNIFSINMLQGNPQTALAQPYSIVITPEMAQKYFGDEPPLGKVLELDQKRQYTVTGIIEKLPQNSHFSVNMLCSFESLRDVVGNQMNRWMGDFQNYTYILLKKGASPKTLEAKFPALVKSQIGELLTALNGKLTLFMQPLEKIHLYSNMLNEIDGGGDIRYIYLFSAIAFLILFIACINFINLTTARSATRSREVGVKKVNGAGKLQLIFQFLGEAFLYTFFAVIIALNFLPIIWPIVKEYTGLEISVFSNNLNWFIGGTFALMIVVGLAAGAYPAFYLSTFNPAQVIKGLKKGSNTRFDYRKVLVITQFVVSIALIACTGIILKQLNYMQNKKLGFKKENLVVIPFDYQSATRTIASLKSELLTRPEIINVTTVSNIPGGGSRQNVFGPAGASPKDAPLICAINVDQDFVPTMKLELVAGRNFSNQFATDAMQSIIINEMTAKKFDWDNPIGKQITEWTQGSPTKTVIGVVKDYHFNSLHNKIQPLIIENEPPGENHWINYFMVSIAGTNIHSSLDFIQSVLENKNSPFPYEYFFLEENFNNYYQQERQLSRIFSYFTSIAIFLACLGLLGLATYTAEQRTKEIGVRKVLGATIRSIIFLLSKEFMKWVLIANLIATPIAWYATSKWLQNFAYRIDLTIWPFLLAGLLAFSSAFLTVTWQAIRAATANPVEALRYE
jgi:putative ABC transport system permease protein